MKILAVIIMTFVSSNVLAAITDNVFSVVSVDSKYTPTSETKHNYRYRAVFSQDYHNEVPDSLLIEKVQRPDAVGSTYNSVWKYKVDLAKLDATKKSFKELPFESALGCCDFQNLIWKNYALHFRVKIGKANFHCKTSDVRKGQPTVSCKK